MQDETRPVPPPPWGRPRAHRAARWLLLVSLVLLFVFAFWKVGNPQQVLAWMAEQEAALREFQEAHPVLVSALAFLLLVAVTGLSLPGATPLTLTYGWFFGFWVGVVLVSVASTVGATVSFLMSRYLFRDAVCRRFASFVRKVDREMERDGIYYLLMLRLMVGVPYFVVNLAMGVTPMRVWTFACVSLVGRLPATSVYTYTGSVVPDLATLAEHGLGKVVTWEFVLALSLLGLFPLVVRRLFLRFRR